jgi:hypothetical protein
MINRSLSKSVPEDTDAAARLLQDLNVLLDIDYANPKVRPLQALAPHFARYADLGLCERIIASYEHIRLTAAGVTFRETVVEALKRCSNMALGLDRSLLVIDVAYLICRDAFSDAIWNRLMFRQIDAELPHWLRSLALRLTQWQAAVCMPQTHWRRALRTVHPTGFEPFVRWGIHQSSTDQTAPMFGTWLLAQARHALSDRAKSFREYDVDAADAEEALDECEALLRSRFPAPVTPMRQGRSLNGSNERAELEVGLVRDHCDPGLWESTQLQGSINSSTGNWQAA